MNFSNAGDPKTLKGLHFTNISFLILPQNLSFPTLSLLPGLTTTFLPPQYLWKQNPESLNLFHLYSA